MGLGYLQGTSPYFSPSVNVILPSMYSCMLSKYLSSFQVVWYVGTCRVCWGLAELALSNTWHLAHSNTIQAEDDPSEPEREVLK